jgi:hypothetical protein
MLHTGIGDLGPRLGERSVARVGQIAYGLLGLCLNSADLCAAGFGQVVKLGL